MAALLLVHGGLWEEGMDAALFWKQPGIVAALERRGFGVLAPDREYRAASWASEASYLAAQLAAYLAAQLAASGLPGRPVTVVAGSNGCSAAVRLALASPEAVSGLVLAWPATAGDPQVDARARADLGSLGAPETVIEALLSGGTLRGVTDEELGRLGMPVGVLPSAHANPFHQRVTVEALLGLLPGAVELPGSPEPPRPEFPPYLEAFADAVAGFADSVAGFADSVAGFADSVAGFATAGGRGTTAGGRGHDAARASVEGCE
jgi:pimeloyl-ACP methyl ester carboxylesterase